MQIQKNVSLASFSTMRLGGKAAFLVEISSEEELLEAIKYSKEYKLPTHVIGSGSNSVFSAKGYNGLVIVNAVDGIEETVGEDGLLLSVGAGVNWDRLVEYTVEKGYSDIALLSLIPGTTGAAPVQNIGAYGQQVSDSVISVRAYDSKSGDFVTLSKDECMFSYRHSRFNTVDKSRFIITSVKMRFSRRSESAPFYADVATYFEVHNINQESVSPANLREAVSTVRVIKLPDPSTVANCGSFFKNPVVSADVFNQLQANFPELKSHQTDDGNLKLYGAQLIDLCGLKDFHDSSTGMATWKNQALVLINESAKSTDDLISFKEKVVQAVEEKFGITLIQEPEFIELV